jgi:membrane fusion protein (multidrug efflux system)
LLEALMKQTLMFRFTCLFALTLTLAGCAGEAEQSAQSAPISVDVQSVQAVAQVPTARLVGRLSASRSAEVRARVEGILLSREYREGSDVEAGALLFRIDPAPLQAAAAEATARLQRARAERSNAAALAERVLDLAKRGVASAQSRDDAQAALRIADAGLAEATATLQRAQLDLSYTRVSAPISGRAGRAEVSEGALVGSDTATLLTHIEQIDPLYVDTTVPASEWATLRTVLAGGAAPEVRIQDADGRSLGKLATVEFADLAADPATGVIALRATLPNPERQLLPGMFVRIEADLPTVPDAILIEAGAILRDARGSYVYVIGEGDKAERREVVLGEQDGARWRVLEGLQPADRLIVSALQRLRPGLPVKAVEATP